MRIGDLLDAEVRDAGGNRIGRVHDVRLVQDGPPVGAFGASLRVDGLVVGPTAIGVRLGFERDRLRGPWVLKALFRTMHRGLHVVGWRDIAAIQEHRIELRAGARAGGPAEEPPAAVPAGRSIDAGLELLDRQMVDVRGMMAGNVDDLELRFPDGAPGAPFVTAILSGPGALSRRIGGRLGAWIASVDERLHAAGEHGPARVSFGVVGAIGSQIDLTVEREHLDVMRFEDWVRDHVIARIPGNDRPPPKRGGD
jgi:sporulation protein YlmC with PRC-barrel domain